MISKPKLGTVDGFQYSNNKTAICVLKWRNGGC